MGRKSGGNILMAFGVVLALTAGAVVFFVVQLNVAKSAEIPKRPVVVVAGPADLSERVIITADKVVLQQWPEDMIPPTAASKVEDVVGKFSKTKLFAKQAVLSSQIAGFTGATDGPAKPGTGGSLTSSKEAEIAYTIEKGKVLVAVSYPSAVPLILAGAVHAGDRVDIIVKAPGTLSDQIATIFRNIEIKAIGSISTAASTDPKALAGGTLIFAVTPQDALILTLIETLDPRVLLRAAGDNEDPPVNVVTTEYIYGRFGLQRPPAEKR
ncbi:MAG: hypothetical protein EXR50_06590 [Dehalococcoidia bacterium]|nr:hypothetical protein [Dehalococcoidia bacterium]